MGVGTHRNNNPFSTRWEGRVLHRSGLGTIYGYPTTSMYLTDMQVLKGPLLPDKTFYPHMLTKAVFLLYIIF